MLASALPDDVGTLLATNMIAGFALELSLKLFYMTFHEKAPPSTHNLDRLWRELPLNWRTEIDREYRGDARSKKDIILLAMQRAPSSPTVPQAYTVLGLGTADGLFTSMSDAFTHARYFYEKVELGQWTHVDSAVHQTLAMIDVLTSFYDHLLTEAAHRKAVEQRNAC